MKKTIGIAAMLLVSSASAQTIDESAINTVDSFENLFGVTEGKRRNHTKGFCFSATFEPVGKEILDLSNSALFTGVSTVNGRLSHKGGNNSAADDVHADYGMGLEITTDSGNTNVMSMNTLDFFPVATPQAFSQLTKAQVEGAEAVKAFKQGNVDLQRFKAHGLTKSKSLKPYEGTTYNSVNSFYLVNDKDQKTAVRWSFVPVVPQMIVVEPKQDFFFDNMKQNLNNDGIVWDMVITIANDDDIVENAALPWLGDHKTILAAKLKVNALAREEDGTCDLVNYDPLILSTGIEPSSDPLLQARRTSYAISFGKRLSEKNTPQKSSK